MSVDLTHRTSFRTRAYAHYLIELTDESQLPELADKLKGEVFIILGSGSNILFADDYAGTVVINALRGQSILAEENDTALVRLGAGENWHEMVCEMTARGLHGLENLALIPGTVGAAPVQNIGAYGVEIADFIEAVEVFDLFDNQLKRLSAADCRFAYRDSIFKRDENRNRYVITAVILRLNKTFSPNLSYQGLNSNHDEALTPQALLERVIAVRQSKLPDPNDVPNAGSFFKNPIVSRDVLKNLQQTYPNVAFFDVDDERVKIPAAWLLDTAGFKGERRDSGAGVYEKHALILVNRGQAHGRDIYQLACDMMATVKAQFNIDLVPEVRIVGVETI